MMKLMSLIAKDFIIFWRSKISLLVMLIAPLLVVLLVGAAFGSSSISGVSVGSYSKSYSSLTNSVISNFEKNGYSVVKYNSADECINSVKTAETQICVVFPPNLSVEGNVDSIIFHVDYSRMNIAYNLIDDLKSSVSVKASEVGVTLAQDLIDALEKAKSSLPTQNKKISGVLANLSSLKSSATSASSSIPDVGPAITSLEDAKDIAESLNSSSLVNKLDDAITELKGIRDGNSSSLSEDIENIQTLSKKIESSLSSVSSEINSLLSTLQSVGVTEAGKIVSPIKTKVESVNSRSTNWDYLFPTLLAIITLFSSLLLSSILAYRARNTKAYFRNFISPTSDFTFIIGSYITCLIILFAQFLLVFAGASWVMGMSLHGMIGGISLILFISATFFIFLGMLIGYTFKSEETVILLAISLASFLMFFSSTILPIETISSGYKQVANYNPLVISDAMLKKVALFDLGISSIFPQAYFLIAGIFIVVLLTYFERKIAKRLS